ncbi:MAG: hypothetical protein K1X50_06565 [Candidatus Promineofilum sp.]|nr:hypothetical protein [Promineifilum sp.]
MQGIALILVIAAAPGLVALVLYVRGLARRVDGLESLRLLDAAERGKLQRQVDELEHGVVVLIAQIRRAGLTPEWSPAPARSETSPAGGQAAETEMLVDLWQRIQENFDEAEMKDLAFELQLRNCAGDTPGASARELVMCAKRHHKLDRLRDVCRRERPEGGF